MADAVTTLSASDLEAHSKLVACASFVLVRLLKCFVFTVD